MALLKLSLLGSFQATLAGQPITHFKGDKVRALLAYLAVEADHPHERASLAGLLWPDMPDDRALRNLSQTLVRLRGAIRDDEAKPPFLIATRSAVQWNRQADYELDSAEFVRLIKTAPTPAALARGVALYGGEFARGLSLSDCPEFETWLLLKREHYQHLALEAMHKLGMAALASGDFAGAQHYARQQISLEAWREVAHRQLMQALVLNGHRSEALAQYATCKGILAEELGVEPEEETTALYEQIRAGQLSRSAEEPLRGSKGDDISPTSPPLRSSAPPHNLPTQLTPLIGRDAELERLSSWLREPERRLVTVTGLGGVGKTRLALAAARQLVGEFADGVWFVPLIGVTVNDANTDVSAGTHASVNTHSSAGAQESLARAIVNALGLTLSGGGSPQSQLFDYLHARQLLLMLDNFEHLLAGADFIAALLQAAPEVRALITSRERLNVEGEFALPLTGLPVPMGVDVEEALDSSCVRLFTERARRIWNNFVLDETNLSHVLHICRAVEGLPLGVELAASWVRHFSLPDIANAIENNLDFLTSPRRGSPERQHSLRAVFDYSWQSLSPYEQRVLAQLSVFRGAFSREAAMAVSDAKLMTLVALVDKSLLRAPAIGRYEMHELVRQFAAQQLQQMANAELDLPDQAHARHSDYTIEFVGTRSEGLYGSSSRQTLAMIGAESDNLNQALHWAMTHGRWEAIDRHIVEILRIYHFQMNYGEGLALAQHLIRHAEDQLRRDPQSVPPHLLSKLVAEQAFLLTFRGTPKEAIASAHAVVVQAHRVGDCESELAGYLDWGLQEYYLGNLHSAQGILEKALTLAQTLSQTTSDEHAPIGSAGQMDAPTRRLALLEAQAMRYLAALRIAQGREEEAREYEREIVQAYRRLHHLWGEARTMMFFGDSHFIVWNYPKAREYYEQGLRIYRDMGNTYGQCHMHVELSRIALFLGDYTQARQHGERALTIIQDLGNVRFHAYALATLSDWAHRTGEHQMAYDYAREAVGIIQTAGQPGIFAYCLDRLGNALTDLRRFHEAAKAYGQSLSLERERGSAALIVMSLANNARIALLRDELVGSQTYANEALELLNAEGHNGVHGLSGASEPWRIYFNLYRALHAAGDDRADEMLRKANALLQDQAAKINDASLRRSFLENVVAYCEIVREYDDLSKSLTFDSPVTTP